MLHLPGLLAASSTGNVITLPHITLSLHIYRVGASGPLQEQQQKGRDEMLAMLPVSYILLHACTKRAYGYRGRIQGLALSALATALGNYKQRYFSKEMTGVNERNEPKAH